ncbi:MAG: hypothetical protein E7370_06115 [Clostridiales bacterium]|nr:hypothetical protein [Clostridiales bacterium]
MEKSKISILEGNELANYARMPEPESRWSHAWGVFKSNFFNIIIINTLMLIFFAPVFALLILRDLTITSGGVLHPFGSNFGTGYPAAPDTVGMAQSIILSADLLYIGLLVVAGLIAAAGVAGGAYSVKKMLTTEKADFAFKDFLRGIKVGYLKALIGVSIFTVILFGCVMVCDWANLAIAMGASAFWPIVAKIAVIILTVLAAVYGAWIIAIGTSYKANIGGVLKTALTLFVATPLQSIFFAAFAVMLAALAFIFSEGFMYYVMFVVTVFITLATACLIWMGYTQWIFDIFLPPTKKDAKSKNSQGKNKGDLKDGKKEKTEGKQTQADAQKDDNGLLLAAGKSALLAKPVLPIEKGEVAQISKGFSRKDIKRVEEEKAQIKDKAQAYSKEHQGDKQYAEYNELFKDREKALNQTDKKGKKKMISPDNLLR